MVHQHGDSIESSTKVRVTFCQIPQKLWATKTRDSDVKLFIYYIILASSTGWFPIHFLLRDSENDLLRNQTERSTGFAPFFEQKIQGLLKNPPFLIRTPFNKKKSLELLSFLLLLQNEQLYREGLSVFAPLGT